MKKTLEDIFIDLDNQIKSNMTSEEAGNIMKQMKKLKSDIKSEINRYVQPLSKDEEMVCSKLTILLYSKIPQAMSKLKPMVKSEDINNIVDNNAKENPTKNEQIVNNNDQEKEVESENDSKKNVSLMAGKKYKMTMKKYKTIRRTYAISISALGLANTFLISKLNADFYIPGVVTLASIAGSHLAAILQTIIANSQWADKLETAIRDAFGKVKAKSGSDYSNNDSEHTKKENKDNSVKTDNNNHTDIVKKNDPDVDKEIKKRFRKTNEKKTISVEGVTSGLILSGIVCLISGNYFIGNSAIATAGVMGAAGNFAYNQITNLVKNTKEKIDKRKKEQAQLKADEINNGRGGK